MISSSLNPLPNSAVSKSSISLRRLPAWIHPGGIDYVKKLLAQVSRWRPDTRLRAATGRLLALIRSNGMERVRSVAQLLGRWGKVIARTPVRSRQSAEWARTFHRRFAANLGVPVLAGVLVGTALLTAGMKTTSGRDPASTGGSLAAQSSGMEGTVVDGQAQPSTTAMSHHESPGTATATPSKRISAAWVVAASSPADADEPQLIGENSAWAAAGVDLPADSIIDAGTATEYGQEPEFEDQQIQSPAGSLEVASAPLPETIGESLPLRDEISRSESVASPLVAIVMDVPHRTPVENGPAIDGHPTHPRGRRRPAVPGVPGRGRRRPGDHPERLRPLDADEAGKVLHVLLVGAARFLVVDVGEPLELRWQVGEALELGARQRS